MKTASSLLSAKARKPSNCRSLNNIKPTLDTRPEQRSTEFTPVAPMDIIQTASNDRQKPLTNIRTRTFFILNKRIDEDVLRNALDSLIRDHWRKLGARLKTNPKNGQPEYHLPRSFEENYALFNWTSGHYDHSIDKIAALPRPTAPEMGIAILPHIHAVEEQFRPANWPLDHKDNSLDTPLLLVHISLFTDASVVAISIPHTVADQFGKANILKAWLGLVKGEAPPPLVGSDGDFISYSKSFHDYPEDLLRRKGKMRVRKWGEYPFVILGYIPELIRDRKEDGHTVFFPLPLVESLRERHGKALAEKYGADPGITNSDIISGILLKLVRLHCKSTKMLSFSQSINLRGRVPQLDRDRDAFIHNALLYSGTRFSVNQSTPLSEIAYLNRKAIIEATDPSDIDTGLAILNEIVRRGQGTHICEPFERSYFVTNWSGAWRGVDFSPALEQEEKVGDADSDLKLLVLGESGILGGPQRFCGVILCKTAEGYWCNLTVTKKVSKLMEQTLKRDPTLESF